MKNAEKYAEQIAGMIFELDDCAKREEEIKEWLLQEGDE